MRIVLGTLVSWGAAGLAAFQFLTRLPVPVRLNYNEELFRRSTLFYPVVGSVLGLLLLLLAWLLQWGGLPVELNAALLLVAWVSITGALHLDGLMDTADGVLSHRSRERMLEIMKDSRVGAMGVIVCVLQLLLKWVLLKEWLVRTGTGEGFALFVIVLLWSRWFMVAAIACWPYARTEQSGGLGGMFRGIGWKQLLASLLLAFGLTVAVMSLLGGRTLFEGVLGALGSLGLCLAAGIAMSSYLSHKLGGLTGDTYGALNELLETVLLILVVLWLG